MTYWLSHLGEEMNATTRDVTFQVESEDGEKAVTIHIPTIAEVTKKGSIATPQEGINSKGNIINMIWSFSLSIYKTFFDIPCSIYKPNM